MAKNKQQKKKERERRVAKKKLADAQKRARAHSAKETQKTAPERTKFVTAAVPKPDYVPTNKKNPFTQRRGGG
ncbi:MAG: hypothetical protein ACE5KM_10065 [Planctomycetaceae bacterium]